MKRNSLQKWLLATVLLLNISFCWSQNISDDPASFIYTVKFAEIQSEEDLKNFDSVLRPIFDVIGFYNAESASVIFRTSARLTQESISDKLLHQGLHLESMTVLHPEHSNSSKR